MQTATEKEKETQTQTQTQTEIEKEADTDTEPEPEPQGCPEAGMSLVIFLNLDPDVWVRHEEVARWGTPIFGNVTALEGLPTELPAHIRRGGPMEGAVGVRASPGPAVDLRPARLPPLLDTPGTHSCTKRELNSSLSGNEVYHAACPLLAILKNSCSKLHSQKGLV